MSYWIQFSSVQFSRSVVSDSLQPHGSQHARSPCPSPTPAVHTDSRPSSQWHHPAISSSVVPFSSCPQSLPASESFPMSQLFPWGGQSTGVSADYGDPNSTKTSCSLTQSCPTLCDSMDCTVPGFPVLHYLLEFAQIHVHWVSEHSWITRLDTT